MRRSFFIVAVLLAFKVWTPALAQVGEREERCSPELPPEQSVDWLTHYSAKERAHWFRRNFPRKIFDFYFDLYGAAKVGSVERALEYYDQDMTTVLGRKLKYSAYPSFLHVVAVDGAWGQFIVSDPLRWIAPISADASDYFPPGYKMMVICYAREEGIKPRNFYKEQRAAGLCVKGYDGQLSCLDDSRPIDPF